MRTEYIFQDELSHVLAALTPENRLVCRVCIATGLRLSDVLSLRPEQLQSQRISVREQKTGKVRRVYVRRELLADLRAQAGPEWVFQHRIDIHRHRTRQAVWQDVKRAAVAFRLPQNVAPHSIRKLYAVQFLEKNGGDVEKLQKQFLHKDLATTMIYAMAAQLYQARYGGGAKPRRYRRK